MTDPWEQNYNHKLEEKWVRVLQPPPEQEAWEYEDQMPLSRLVGILAGWFAICGIVVGSVCWLIWGK